VFFSTFSHTAHRTSPLLSLSFGIAVQQKKWRYGHCARSRCSCFCCSFLQRLALPEATLPLPASLSTSRTTLCPVSGWYCRSHHLPSPVIQATTRAPIIQYTAAQPHHGVTLSLVPLPPRSRLDPLRGSRPLWKPIWWKPSSLAFRSMHMFSFLSLPHPPLPCSCFLAGQRVVHTDTTTVKRPLTPVAFGRHRHPQKGRARPTCVLAPGLEAARDPPRRDGLQDAAWEHGVWTAQPFLVMICVATRPPVHHPPP